MAFSKIHCFVIVCFIFEYGKATMELAKGRRTSTSSLHAYKWNSSNVVDGDLNTNIFCDSCLITKADGEASAWWQVQLDGVYVVNRVEIYSREPYDTYNCPSAKPEYPQYNEESDRLKKYFIFISNDTNWATGIQCYKEPSGPDEYPDLYQNNSCVGVGSFLTIFTNHTATFGNIKSGACLTICEVKVYGCERGKFGWNCNETCDNCRYSNCESDRGHCLQGCKDYWFGSNCAQQCGHCRHGEVCSETNGTCTNGCEDGWYGPYCNTECDSGTYGENCQLKCGHCLNNEACDHSDGKCTDGCVVGYIPPLCKEECGYGTYGENCQLKCGHCLNNETCDHIDGKCTDGCDVGYMPPLCQENSEVKVSSSQQIIIGLAITSAVFFLAFVFVLILLLRKQPINCICFQRSQKNEKENVKSSVHNHSCTYEERTHVQEMHIYETLKNT